MFISRELKYILLASVSALFISAVLGLFCGLSFFTILVRSLLQFVFFFVIGLLIEYIFKKYLSNLFSTELSGNMENKPQDDKKSDKDFKE
ncbi:RNA chaperone Hfq, partial [Borreliella burgdorferi]|nr:RNA chaperone Hfq [Borreliella burgdorferi]